MSNFLPVERRALLQRLLLEGVPQRKISTIIGVSRVTVRRYAAFVSQGIDISRLDDYYLMEQLG